MYSISKGTTMICVKLCNNAFVRSSKNFGESPPLFLPCFIFTFSPSLLPSNSSGWLTASEDSRCSTRRSLQSSTSTLRPATQTTFPWNMFVASSHQSTNPSLTRPTSGQTTYAEATFSFSPSHILLFLLLPPGAEEERLW